MSNRLNWQPVSNFENITNYNIYRSIVGVESAADETFPLSNGMNLQVRLDDGVVQSIVFNPGSFIDITHATADEVIQVLSSNIIGGIVHRGISGSVYIRSSLVSGSVQIVGGSANAVFGFSTLRVSAKSNFIKIATVAYTPGTVEYIDQDGGVYDWYRITAVDNMSVESAPTLEKQAGPSRDPICIIYGTLQSSDGHKIPDQQIVATIEYPPQVNGITSTWVSKEPQTVLSLQDGTFELELLRGASYRIDINSVEYSRIVKIPDQADANLFTLEFSDLNVTEPAGDNFNY